jgi:hypothetical protein
VSGVSFERSCAVALDGVGEFREVAVADHAAELPLGFKHPGRGPAQGHVA